MKTLKKMIAVFQILVLIVVLFPYLKVEAAAVDEVVTIDWTRFTSPNPTDSDSIKARDLLLKAVKYQLGWLNTLTTDANGLYVITWDNSNEVVNHYAKAALAIAVAIKTDIYSEAVTGVTITEATNRAVKMIKTLGFKNKGTTATGWGNSWQSPISAAYAGQAAWLLWGNLDQDGKNWSSRMVEYEANVLNNFVVPYYRNDAGTIISPGNTRAEENAWRSTVFQAAIAMMPNHANISLWKSKCVELMVSAFSRPSDTTSATIIDGKTVNTWLNGSNIEENGTLINHGFIHPDYMNTFSFNLQSYLMFSLAGISVPQSAKFNAAIVYDALVDLNFSAPPYDAPGGTIYKDGSEEIYYPQGTDWSTFRFDIYYGVDAPVSRLGLDTLASTGGLTWERLRATRLQAMQARFTDGHLYGAGEWDSNIYKEQTAAAVFSRVYLLNWLIAQGELSPVASWNIGGSVSPIDNDDPAVTYTGTTQTYAHAADIGGTHTVLQSSGATAVIAFTGTNAKVVGLKGPNSGNVKVYVDNVLKTTVDLYNATTLYQYQIYDTGTLSSGSHTVKLEAIWTKNPLAANYYVAFDALTLGTVVDNDDAAATYTGTTQTYTDAADIGGSHTVLKSSGATAVIAFTGTNTKVVGLKGPNSGNVKVYVDNVLKTTVDLYNATTLYQYQIYDTGALSSGSHTVKLEAIWTKNPLAANYYVAFDALTVTN